MPRFPLRNGQQSITTNVCEIISVWGGRSRVFISKGEPLSQKKNVRRFYVSSLEEFPFCRKRQYSYNERDSLKLRGNRERNFEGAFSSFFFRLLFRSVRNRV